jgi:hypothetical protein
MERIGDRGGEWGIREEPEAETVMGVTLEGREK